MQILIKADLTALLDSLGHHSNGAGTLRRGQIKRSCSGAEELALTVAEHYRRSNPERTPVRREAVRRHTEFYSQHCHIRVAKQDNRTVGGFCVLGGELLCLHNYEKGHGPWMLDQAIALGAKHLTCFDVPHLIKLYEGRGFEVTGRMDNWNQTGPDVVSMKLKVN